MPGQILVDFSVSWDGLGYLGGGILIPVVFSPVPDEYAPHPLDFSDQVFSFHD